VKAVILKAKDPTILKQNEATSPPQIGFDYSGRWLRHHIDCITAFIPVTVKFNNQ
jgi:hypothetical protein